MSYYDRLIEALWNAPISKLRETAWAFGPVDPFGDGDSKTAAPGTYRKVGAGTEGSCHVACELMGQGCYAQGGNVNLHQVRAGSSAGPSLRAAAAAMVWAHRTGRLARLHVSGDFLERGRVDRHYVDGLCALADRIRTRIGKPDAVVAWTYTHIPRERFEPYRIQLMAHGIVVRYSGRWIADGKPAAIVVPREHVPAWRASNPGVKAARCPAQIQESTTCDSCRICSDRPDMVVLFAVEGSQKKKAAAAALRVIQ